LLKPEITYALFSAFFSAPASLLLFALNFTYFSTKFALAP